MESSRRNRVLTPEGKWIRLRMGLFCGILSLGMGIVIASGWDLMIRDGEDWRGLAEQQRERRLQVRPKRGIIYDRNGSALAVSVEVPTISLDARELLRGVDPADVPRVAREAATRIAHVLDLDSAKVERKILSKRRWTWLRRHASAEQVDAVRKLSKGEQGEKIRGLMIDGEPMRFYPRRELAGSLLGFVSPDGKGRDGLEYSLNDQLEGHPDQLRGLRDRAGRLIFTDGIEDERAFAGHNIELTIDQGIQFAAERELASSARAFEAKGGSVVVVDPRTGEILALASWPGFNPNDYTQSAAIERRNRAVGDSLSPARR